ncbi:tyrosine-type recombinase/integrase [Microlunatus ginsengisoli]|uniref:tyrosine-type recombinase/integrase n=1 Tax=Microlunatus ginsengisoli TaxID=363863 RepID=UPI0031E1289F
MPATAWLLQTYANDNSRNTIRAYGLSLLRFMRYLWAIGVPWDRAREVDVRDFVLWGRRADKFVGRRREPAPRSGVNIITGKANQTSKYSPSTINLTLTAVGEFYEFHRQRQAGPIINPVPGAGERRHPHHRPDDPYPVFRRGQLRQKEPIRDPRAIPDDKFDELFRRLGTNRDRALVAFYVSSGARATELLGLTGDRVNYGDQMIGVIRKGGQLRWLPAAPQAFVWLRLYQVERGVARRDQPVWLTSREPYRQMSYDTFRSVLNRANRVLHTNWSTHDLRHTFAIRALEGGMPLHILQNLLDHASLETTTIYARPRPEEVVAHHRATFSRSQGDDSGGIPVSYDPGELDSLFGGRES